MNFLFLLQPVVLELDECTFMPACSPSPPFPCLVFARSSHGTQQGLLAPPTPQPLISAHSYTLCRPSSRSLTPQTSRDHHLTHRCLCRRGSPWSPGPYQLLLHVAHEGAGTGPQGGLDRQAHAGRVRCSWEGPGWWLWFLGSAREPRVLSSPQDDLHIVDSLDLPTADPQYLTELAQYRRWGSSVLLVDL